MNASDRPGALGTCPVCRGPRISEWGRARDMCDAQMEHTVCHCHGCGHRFVRTSLDRRDLGRAYTGDEGSLFFNAAYYEKRQYSPYTHGELWVLDHIARQSRRPGRFLDVGSVGPKMLTQVMKSGWEVTAVDPGKHVEAMAARIGCSAKRAMFEEAEFPEPFDMISALDVLEHSADPVAFLTHLKRTLSDGGVALLRFPNSSSLRRVLHGVKWEMVLPLGHLHFFSPRSFAAASRQAGLHINHWVSRDVFRYSDLRIPALFAKAAWRLRSFLDDRGWGDQMLVCVSGSAGSCTALPRAAGPAHWREPVMA